MLCFFSPFHFLSDPCDSSARSLDNGIQQKLQEEILLQQNDQASDIQPPFGIHRTLSVSTSQSWGHGRTAACEFVCAHLAIWKGVFGRAVLCSCSRLQCKRCLVTSRACCRSWHLLRRLGNGWSGFVQSIAMN